MSKQCLVIEQDGVELTVHPFLAINENPVHEWETASKLIAEGFKKAAGKLKLENIDLTVYSSEYDYTMPEFGFGAITFGSNAMSMTISPNYQGLKASLVKELPALMAHELSHAARFKAITIPYNGWTLRESLAMEGLAEFFQEELYPEASIHINKNVLKEVDTWLLKAIPLFDKQRIDYNHDEWFFGTKTAPRWIGYTLGYYLIKRLLNDNKLSIEEAVILPTCELITGS